MASINGGDGNKGRKPADKPRESTHFNIFGDVNMIITPSKRRIPIRSNIDGCFGTGECKHLRFLKEEPMETKKGADEADQADKKGNLEERKAEAENIQPKAEDTEADDDKSATARVHVPPGGFSSRLW